MCQKIVVVRICAKSLNDEEIVLFLSCCADDIPTLLSNL